MPTYSTIEVHMSSVYLTERLSSRFSHVWPLGLHEHNVHAVAVPGPRHPVHTSYPSTCCSRPAAPFSFVAFPHTRPSSVLRILLTMSLTLSPHLARDLALRLVYFCPAAACGSSTVPYRTIPSSSPPLPSSFPSQDPRYQTALRILVASVISQIHWRHLFSFFCRSLLLVPGAGCCLSR